jgi:hypothetical protein
MLMTAPAMSASSMIFFTSPSNDKVYIDRYMCSRGSSGRSRTPAKPAVSLMIFSNGQQ